MRFLSRHRSVITVDELAEAVANRRPISGNSVILTFDDGYLDNLTVVAPILAKYGLPAILYLCTGYVARGENQWSDRLYTALRNRTIDHVSLPGLPVVDLRDAQQRGFFNRSLGEHLIRNAGDRSDLLSEVERQLAPKNERRRLTLQWDEVRQLKSQFPQFELGIHTSDHVDLTAVEESCALEEISKSASEFKAELGYAPRHFSYPYGRRTESVTRRLGELGVVSAVGESGVVSIESSDPFALPRLLAPRSKALFRLWTSSAHPDTSLAFLGRA
ncbi:MAG: polysaccharide deacetylase family protein [Planctomycetota bacterium]